MLLLQLLDANSKLLDRTSVDQLNTSNTEHNRWGQSAACCGSSVSDLQPDFTSTAEKLHLTPWRTPHPQPLDRLHPPVQIIILFSGCEEMLFIDVNEIHT